MLPRVCVAVPTYWTRAGGAPVPGDAVYDHPTPLDGASTLPALLESLEKLDSATYILLLIVAVTSVDVAQDAEKRVREMLERHPTIRRLIFGHAQYERLRSNLGNAGLQDSETFIALRDYPRIRNLQLAVPLALGSQVIVALDDDEIVVVDRFLEKAVEPLGTRVDGRLVDGLSGHYLQPNGSIMLDVDPAKAASHNLFDAKAAIMNRGTEVLESELGNLVYTPFCFGGNMEFSRELAASVGFDPGITRGEDIDYLINARMEGRNFFLRKDLRILHCPPQGGSYRDVKSSKVEQDILRFLYEQEKLRVSQINDDVESVYADDLMPYPGEFLRQDVARDAVEALESAGFAGDPEQFVRRAQEGVSVQIDRYLEFRRRWPQFTKTVHQTQEIQESLVNEVSSV